MNLPIDGNTGNPLWRAGRLSKKAFWTLNGVMGQRFPHPRPRLCPSGAKSPKTNATVSRVSCLKSIPPKSKKPVLGLSVVTGVTRRFPGAGAILRGQSLGPRFFPRQKSKHSRDPRAWGAVLVRWDGAHVIPRRGEGRFTRRTVLWLCSPHNSPNGMSLLR